jgi:hypothetical protein
MEIESARFGDLDLWLHEKKRWQPDDYATSFQTVRLFYNLIERNNPELLSFNYLGDKWQVLYRWIHEHEGDLNN